jgi:hypothetical protein
LGETAWFKTHPAITAEEREKMRAQGEKNQGVLALHRASKKAFPPCPDVVPGEKGIQIPLSPEGVFKHAVESPPGLPKEEA